MVVESALPDGDDPGPADEVNDALDSVGRVMRVQPDGRPHVVVGSDTMRVVNIELDIDATTLHDSSHTVAKISAVLAWWGFNATLHTVDTVVFVVGTGNTPPAVSDDVAEGRLPRRGRLRDRARDFRQLMNALVNRGRALLQFLGKQLLGL